MGKFRGADSYGIENLLSEEERMIRDAVRDWVEAEFLPIVGEHHRTGTFPVSLIPQLGELGVFGATLKGYGCAGLNNVAYGLIMEELERGDSGLRSAASVQSGLVMYPIYSYGSDAHNGHGAVGGPKEDDGEIYGYLVERGPPGFSTLDIHGKFSMRASITSELSFQDCGRGRGDS